MAGILGIEHRGDTRRLASARALLVWLCVLLAVVAGTVQVAHSHAAGPDTHADCSLCVAAHVAVDVVQVPVGMVPFVAVTEIEAVAQPAIPSTVSVFALFTRPPPAT